MHEFQVRDAIQCLLHTILFVRAPGPLRPREALCDHFDLTYARCGVIDVDKLVDAAVEDVWQNLVPAGPDLHKGTITLIFFERRITKSMFGLVSNEEKVAWEHWIIPFVISGTAMPSGDDEASEIAKMRMKEQTEEALASRIEFVVNAANGPIDHMPPVMYEFSITCKPPLS
mmetsp:Transcript_4895/g.7001  ORF Transcript_4895/g.7001 Transcript_4895/m.7001 type:complete len:172 (+) Transcript_4895:37-552(+)